MNERILAEDGDESILMNEFEQACEDPEGCDCGFVAQREASGFANFGFDPTKAAEMREKELARIAAELEAEPLDYSDEDEDDDLFDEWEVDEDDDLDDLDDEDEFDDRYEESYGSDLEDDWRDE